MFYTHIFRSLCCVIVLQPALESRSVFIHYTVFYWCDLLSFMFSTLDSSGGKLATCWSGFSIKVKYYSLKLCFEALWNSC